MISLLLVICFLRYSISKNAPFPSVPVPCASCLHHKASCKDTQSIPYHFSSVHDKSIVVTSFAFPKIETCTPPSIARSLARPSSRTPLLSTHAAVLIIQPEGRERYVTPHRHGLRYPGIDDNEEIPRTSTSQSAHETSTKRTLRSTSIPP